MLLYYSWLPVEREPEYCNGFYCDKCGSENTEGPLFHCKLSKRDLCVECGRLSGFSVFQGLVAALFFPSKSNCLFDEELSSLPLFVFQTSVCSYGVFFSCGSNLLFTVDGASSSFILYEKPREKFVNLEMNLVAQRFSWLLRGFRATFDCEVRFHPAPPISNDAPLLIDNFYSSSDKVKIMLKNETSQVLLCDNGVECIFNGSNLISFFDKCVPGVQRNENVLNFELCL